MTVIIILLFHLQNPYLNIDIEVVAMDLNFPETM